MGTFNEGTSLSNDGYIIRFHYFLIKSENLKKKIDPFEQGLYLSCKNRVLSLNHVNRPLDCTIAILKSIQVDEYKKIISAWRSI